MPARKYTDEQRDRFFEVLDRGGTIRAAAAAAGVHPDAGYRWVKRAGIGRARRAPREYSQEDKDRFFRLLAERGNVSAVARELGFVRVTCYKWAHQAGIFTGKSADAKRQEFTRLRAAGLTRAEAAEQAGVDRRSAADWDKGIRAFYGGRIYPDGRIVHYRPEQRLAAVKSPRASYVQGEPVDLARVERVIHSRYLSLLERERLHDLHRAGLSMRAIAVELGRAPSTISRELARNTTSTRGYLPHGAHRASVQRRRRPKQHKLIEGTTLRKYVEARLRKKWSPQQISHRLIKDFPGDLEMRVSTETIYQAIYVHARGELKRELARQLRRGRAARKPRRDPNARTPRFVEPMTPIATRPAEVDARAVPGHWEGDLIVGAASASAIATLVERSSRFVLLGHLAGGRSADAVRDALVAQVTSLPDALRRSLTWDQGAEMAEHRSFTTATGMSVFFCDAGSPWQRGSNENTNGLLRQYFVKGTDLRVHDRDALQRVADELNTRPRRSLDWETPAERLAALMDAS
jgi:IS30 family transposase/transposase-like protein